MYTYTWEKGSVFNSNNMLILNLADSDPKALILHNVIKILDKNPAYKGTDKEIDIEKIKTEHLFYLCGSDFFINRYSDSSRYSIIYVLRKSEEEMIKNKEAEVEKYSNKNYLKIPIVMPDSDEYSLSSSVVREDIQKLGTSLLDTDRTKLQNDIIKYIGLLVYCYLGNLDYLIQKEFYGKICDSLDATVSKEIESVHDFEMGDYEGIGEDADILNDDEWSDYQIDLLAGELDKIPENDRNIFIDINTFVIFDRQTIKDEATFDKIMDDLISCETINKEGIDFKSIKDFLKNIYDSKIYYILNDLCYFKLEIDAEHCFIQNLLSNGESNTNLLAGINLLSTDQFNANYLTGEEGMLEKIVDDRIKYLASIKADKYKDYDGNTIKEEIVDEILGFLYDSERYSLYLYLIDDVQPIEGKQILLRLYSAVIEEKNDKVKEIVEDLNDELNATIERSKKETGPPEIPKKLRGPTGSKEPLGPKRADDAKGESELLKAVNYIQQRSNGDGNCFYNSIGMLSSNYVIVQDMFGEYQRKSISEKYYIQFAEQSRVRTELAEFMLRIYNIIKNVDKGSRLYKNSSIIKYIVENGDKNNNFKYVSTIKTPVGGRYFGTDSEIYFASLYYRQPIVTVTGISDVSVFNIFYWDHYDINGVDFIEYIRPGAMGINAIEVLHFIENSSQQLSCGVDDISVFLLYYPSSYFLVGGRGHWSYAVNKNLLVDEGTKVYSRGGSEGSVHKYNPRVTKKIRNKYHKKSSSKLTKKHKRTKKMKNRKGKKKTIKHGR